MSSSDAGWRVLKQDTHRILDGGLVHMVAVGVAEHVEMPAPQEGVPRPALRRVRRKVQLASILPHPDADCVALQPTMCGLRLRLAAV